MNNEKPMVRYLTVKPDEAGQRLDNYLMKHLKGLPKSNLYRILRKGEVRVNKGRVKPDYRIVAADQIRIPPLRLSEVEPSAVPHGILKTLEAAILYEDPYLLVLNKPAGIPVHGGSGLNYGVIEALKMLRPQIEALELVHRLDKETSGCLLLAKKRQVLVELHEMLRLGQMNKSYLSLVKGRWPAKLSIVEAPLLKNQMSSGERIVKVNNEGKPAKTMFKSMVHYLNATLVEASPITGRTHQIRVHAAYGGCPIAGDSKYGHAEFNQLIRRLGCKRMFLHAAKLKFKLLGQQYEFAAPLPDELQALLNALPKT